MYIRGINVWSDPSSLYVTLFLVSTQTKMPKDFTVSDLGVVTSELLTQALLRSVNAEPYPKN